MKKSFLPILVLLTLLAVSGFAKPYYVLKVEGSKAYLDITRSEPISSKLLNVFSRPEIIKHPVSGKEMEISKKLGTLILSEVKEEYSVATIPPNLANLIEAGQKIEFVSSEPIDTAGLAFGEEALKEMGKNRNIISFGGNYHYIDAHDLLYGMDITYTYNFLLSYLYSIDLGMTYMYGEAENEIHKFISAKMLLEWKLGSYVSFLTGGRGGVKKEGSGYGLEGGIRLGKPYGTNVLIKGSTVEDLGLAGFIQLNGKVGEGWVNFTVQVDNYPAKLSKETFRVRIGGKTAPISGSSVLYAGIVLAGRDTDTVGFGGDLGIEVRF